MKRAHEDTREFSFTTFSVYLDVFTIVLSTLDILSVLELACTNKTVRSSVKKANRSVLKNHYSLTLCFSNNLWTTRDNVQTNIINQTFGKLFLPIDSLELDQCPPTLPHKIRRLICRNDNVLGEVLDRFKTNLETTQIAGHLDGRTLAPRLRGLRFVDITITHSVYPSIPFIEGLEECKFNIAKQTVIMSGLVFERVGNVIISSVLRRLYIRGAYRVKIRGPMPLSPTVVYLKLFRIHLGRKACKTLSQSNRLEEVDLDGSSIEMSLHLPLAKRLVHKTPTRPPMIAPNLQEIASFLPRYICNVNKYPTLTSIRLGMYMQLIRPFMASQLQHLDCWLAHDRPVIANMPRLQSLRVFIEIECHTHPVVDNLPQLKELAICNGRFCWVANLPSLSKLCLRNRELAKLRMDNCPTSLDCLEYKLEHVEHVLHLSAKHHNIIWDTPLIQRPNYAGATEITMQSWWRNDIHIEELPPQITTLNLICGQAFFNLTQHQLKYLTIRAESATLNMHATFPNLERIQAHQNSKVFLTNTDKKVHLEAYTNSLFIFE